ncbi:MAG: NADH-quinone oxidoreductase subunit NuoN [Planktomarina sp.]
MISADLSVVLPELALAIYAMLALVGIVYTGKDKLASASLWMTAGVFLLLALWIGFGADETQMAFSDTFVSDSFAKFAKVVILVSAAIVLLMSQDYMTRHDLMRFEYPLLIALSVVGMMVMVSASDLMVLYMGLELQSLALYVVASLRRDHSQSTEAGLKYFVLGALSSGLLLYGSSLVYGYAGTTSFEGIIETTQQGDISVGLLIGLVFVLSGLAFKVSAAPFHMWTPDVYEGSPTPITAFFATAPKMAAMALFARVVHDAFGGAVGDWQQVIAAFSVISMFMGAFAAIGQTDIKRLMAYSSIGHMGFALMGLAAGNAFGVQAMLIYMAIYVTMNLGTFALILMMQRDGQPVSDIRSLNMLSKSDPLKAISLLALMFSLAGVPPMVGFFGKLYVLRAAFEGGLAWLAVAGVVASVISAFYYLRIVYYMYFGEEVEPMDRGGPMVLQSVMAVVALIMVFGMVNLFGIEGPAVAAANALAN